MDSWVDTPQKDRQKDKLERGPFVDMAAKLIEGLADSNDSTVFGLVGPWGSGKTSVLNFITSALDRSIHVVKFNPWSFDEDRLQAELYSATLEAFPSGSRETFRKKAVDLARRSAPALKAIPIVGTGASETLREFLPAKSWDSAFQDMANTIHEASVKVLVVVDDVDRVQPKDLLLLMKTIRLLGRFPRVNYLLAYDRKSTIKALASALGSDTSDAQVYLEKIVQYPLDLPDPQQHFLQKIIDATLQPIVAKASQDADGGPTPQVRFESFYTQHMVTTLTTPRACHRYTGQARTFLQLAEGDVDPADFFALTFLRIFYPDLYRLLPSWRGELTRSATSRGVKVTSKDEWIKRIASCGYEGDTGVDLMEALASLFPHAFPGNSWGMSGGHYRVSNSDYFDRYFTFSLPAGDMSDAAVVRDLKRIRRGELAACGKCQETFDHPNEQMQLKALKKGSRHTDHRIDGRHLIDYLTAQLSQQSTDQDFRSATLRLRSAWLADLLWHCDPWEGPEITAFVEKFSRPSVLGHCLNLLKNRSESAIGQGIPDSGQTFLRELAAAWNKQATDWLLEDWLTTGSDTSVEERFTVWQTLVALDGLDDLQSKTIGAVRDGSLALTALATKFVMSSTTAGDYQAPASKLTLFMEKLENSVPPDTLMTLPLNEPEAVPAAQGEEIPSPAQRARFAYEEIIRWRENRVKAATDDGRSPEG